LALKPSSQLEIGNAQAVAKKRLLFVNKKQQKSSVHLGQGRFTGLAKRTKSFLVLFYKLEPHVFIDFLSLMDGLGVTEIAANRSTRIVGR